MTPEQIEIYRKAADLGTIPDNMNPLFLLQGVHPHLLIRIVNLEFNVQDLAKHELQSRGLNEKGEWAGFKKEQKSSKPLKRNHRKGRGI